MTIKGAVRHKISLLASCIFLCVRCECLLALWMLHQGKGGVPLEVRFLEAERLEVLQHKSAAEALHSLSRSAENDSGAL